MVDQRCRDHPGGDAGGAADRPGADRQQLGERGHPGAPRATGRGDPAEGRVGGARATADPRRHRRVGVVEAADEGAAGWRQCGEEGRRGVRGGAVGAQGRAAVGAGAQVLAQGGDVGRPRLVVGERREQRRQLGAAGTAVAADEEAAEALPSLRHATVHLRRRIARDLGDLAIRVALGEQAQRPQLLRLQRRQRLAAALDRLVALGPLGRAVEFAREERDPVLLVRVYGQRGGAGEDPLALGADRERLVFDHGLGPADQFAWVVGGRLQQQDLEPALERFVGVVIADRVARRGPPQARLVAGERLDHDPLARRLLDRHAGPVNFQRGPLAPRTPARNHCCSTLPVRFILLHQTLPA
jgi:hypothetical protein